ncbi:hypothetical protein NP603_03425 [Methylomonas sp. SURF-1]|uniref:Uncharacterized protein n=1 Tax=Methylomonas aurea TaxID=2952224 RepID=A0ABT1UD56_9GAMM|nr:hypothetical protein [Methylomonas sp. SURF-1]MCQ8180151.1 hypothetical protein [Methylomonas sp. SURF-1]
MNHSKLLTACLHELKRCAISLLFIVIGLILATANAPAAERSAPAGTSESVADTASASAIPVLTRPNIEFF